MALVNYELIQRAVQENPDVLLADAPSLSKSASATFKLGVAEQSRPESSNVRGVQLPRQIPNLFKLSDSRPNDEDLLPAEGVEVDYKSLAPKDWLFGQWNRLLPAKATSRALLNIMCEHPSGISVNDAAGKISYAACDLGDYLKMLDARHSCRREDSLAAAFPSTSSTGAQSRLRYGNQFVGTISTPSSTRKMRSPK